MPTGDDATTAQDRGAYPAMVACRTCLDNEWWQACSRCGGKGGLCSECEGVGEVRGEGDCPDCGGGGEVSFALMKVRDADDFVRHNDPGWDGQPWSHPGTTMYSTAAYFRNRGDLKRRTTLVCGRKAGGETVVLFYGEYREQLASFPGWSWGYSGEGPTGLAAVLSDLWPEQFPTMNESMAFVCRLPQSGNWERMKEGPTT